jgi:hypothetical protein
MHAARLSINSILKFVTQARTSNMPATPSIHHKLCSVPLFPGCIGSHHWSVNCFTNQISSSGFPNGDCVPPTSFFFSLPQNFQEFSGVGFSPICAASDAQSGAQGRLEHLHFGVSVPLVASLTVSVCVASGFSLSFLPPLPSDGARLWHPLPFSCLLWCVPISLGCQAQWRRGMLGLGVGRHWRLVRADELSI